MIEVSEMKRKFYQAIGMEHQIQSNLNVAKTNLENLNKRIKLIEKAQCFLQKVAQDTQSQLKFQIEDIVNLALNTVFPDEYLFKVDFNIFRGKTDAELVFINQKTGGKIDPMSACGGGVVDVTCFALRLANYSLSNDSDNVLILDEPMKFVSKDLLQRVCDVIKLLSQKLNLQIIMVTHESQFIDISDKIFEVKKNFNGISKVVVKEFK